MPLNLASIAGPLVGGFASALGARRQNRMARQMAREQMAFQERMSSTAYQRATKDLEKAGLNRILALGKPASSPAGAMAPVVDEIGPAVSSAMAVRRQNQDLANLRSQENLANAQAANVQQDTLNKATQGLILKHGEVVASFIANLGRTVYELTNNMTPKELAEFIKKQFSNAKNAELDFGNMAGTTAWMARQKIGEVTNDVIDYVGGMFEGPEERSFKEWQNSGLDVTFEEYERRRKSMSTREFLKWKSRLRRR